MADMTIKVVDNEGITKFLGEVNSDGSFVVSNLNADSTYDVYFSSEEQSRINASREVSRASSTSGYGGWLSSVVATVGSGNNVGSVAMKPLGTIKGVVTLADAEEGESYGIDVYIPGSSYTAKTDDYGNYAIYNVPEGVYQVRFEKAGYTSIKSESFTIKAENDTDNPVVELPTSKISVNVGSLSGSVKLAGVTDFTGIIVKIENDKFSKTDSTSSDGSFKMTDIKPGTYTVTFSCTGYISQCVEKITVTSAQNTSITEIITLEKGQGTVSGQLCCSDVSDLSSITVSVIGTEYSSQTDSNGYYSISVPEGNYSGVEVNSTCYETAQIKTQIAIFSGNTITLDPLTIVSNHNFSLYDTKESTCSEQGYNVYRCWNCGIEKIEYLPLAAHTNTLVDAKSATCTEEGWEKYHCSVCDQDNIVTVPALGHNWSSYTITKEATCYSEGSRTATCSRCGETIVETIEKTNHSWYEKSYEDGKITYCCSNCGQELVVEDSYIILQVSESGAVSLRNEVDTSTLKTIIIPDEIDGIKVTSVFEYAFQDISSITTIILPDTLESIGSWAFAGTSITSTLISPSINTSPPLTVL